MLKAMRGSCVETSVVHSTFVASHPESAFNFFFRLQFSATKKIMNRNKSLLYALNLGCKIYLACFTSRGENKR